MIRATHRRLPRHARYHGILAVEAVELWTCTHFHHSIKSAERCAKKRLRQLEERK